MIPAAPPASPAAAALVGHLVGGIAGTCSMCNTTTVTWLDLIAAGLEPVADERGALTDHAALHERCVWSLLDYWASLGEEGGPVGSTDSGTTDDGADVPDGPAPPSSPIAPLGIYA